MAVIEQDIVENSGLIKEFDEEGTEMLMDIIQKDLYTKPIESAIREVFSNCYDGIKERNIARSILTEETTIADHFAESDEISKRSSKFNPNYYDLKYLSNYNKVKITYIESTSERDSISIEDFGVGLANGRLVGFMKPGYSSKRLSKSLLGKFGKH